MANKEVSTKVELPICISFTAQSISAVTQKEQFMKEKFPNYRIIEPESISDLIIKARIDLVKGLIIDPVIIASLNPSHEEHREIVRLVKLIAHKGRVQFAFGTIPSIEKISNAENERRRKYAIEFVSELNALLNPDTIFS